MSPLKMATAKVSELIHHYHEKHPIDQCQRCGRMFTWHPHRPSDFPTFYRDKCNRYHPGKHHDNLSRKFHHQILNQSNTGTGKLTTGDEAIRRFGQDRVKHKNPTGVPDQLWDCCLRTEDGRCLYGGCSFSSDKHVPTGETLPQPCWGRNGYDPSHMGLENV